MLRAEKGFVIVGQDTDGTVTPDDLGCRGSCQGKGDFIGRRSLLRADTARPDRKQLVGLLPNDPTRCSPEGAQSWPRRARAAGADAGPRHLELPQRRAGSDVRAGHGGGRAR